MSFWTIFCPFTLQKPKKSKFWKNEKNGWRYYHFTQVYHKWQSDKKIRDKKHDWQNFLLFWTIFCSFTPYLPLPPPIPPNNLKNQNFEKLKKTPQDIIILHMCTKNHDHMLYCSLDIVCDRCNSYCSFWAIFCPSPTLTAQKIKILKKWKKHL